MENVCLRNSRNLNCPKFKTLPMKWWAAVEVFSLFQIPLKRKNMVHPNLRLVQHRGSSSRLRGSEQRITEIFSGRHVQPLILCLLGWRMLVLGRHCLFGCRLSTMMRLGIAASKCVVAHRTGPKTTFIDVSLTHRIAGQVRWCHCRQWCPR